MRGWRGERSMPKTRKKKFIDVEIYFIDLKKYKQKEIREIAGDTILPSPLTVISFEFEDEITFEMDKDLKED